jgi:hypothetical protein
MKVPLHSDREVDLKIFAKFFVPDMLWELETTPSRIRMAGKGNFELAIPGRRPEEIEFFILRFKENDDLKEIKIYPEILPDGEMAPLVIYDGSRDYWTHRLRQAALAVKP